MQTVAQNQLEALFLGAAFSFGVLPSVNPTACILDLELGLGFRV